MSMWGYGRPVYGTEGGRPNYLQSLDQMAGMVRSRQAATPVYQPYAPGTLTGQGNTLLQQAREHADAMQAARMAPPETPKASDLRYGVSLRAYGMIDDWLKGEATARGKQQLDPEEVGAWADENLPDIKNWTLEQGYGIGLPAREMEGLLTDLENYVNAKAGRPQKPSLESDTADILQRIFLTPFLEKLQSGGLTDSK